jgi:transcriptional regulator with XRE-family HTH domain
MTPPSFGEKLRRERERHDTTIEEIAAKTKIALRFLQALEKDDFDALPGRAFGKFYIRAYAEVLGFDPEPLIVEYERERSAEDATDAGPPTPEPVKPRRMQAEIERWREARLAGPKATATAEPGSEAEEHGGDAGLADSIPEAEASEAGPRAEPAPSTAFDREEDRDAAGYDEDAALASILGAHVPPTAPVRRRRYVVASVLGGGLLILLAWALVSSLAPDRPVDDRPPRAVEGSPAQPSAGEPRESGDDEVQPETAASDATSRPATSASAEIREEAAAPPVAVPPETADEPRRLTVSEFGVGRRVVDHRLEGRADSFEEGRVVYFQTRVVGGRRGDEIRHVWMREGRVVQAVDLAIGGAHWRTHSRKTLWGTGRWAVEARDLDGHVLARTEFTCVPAER